MAQSSGHASQLGSIHAKRSVLLHSLRAAECHRCHTCSCRLQERLVCECMGAFEYSVCVRQSGWFVKLLQVR